MKKFKFKFLLLFPVIFFVVIATYFIFTASYPIVFADPAEFVVGDGTVDNPYQVSNCEQLQLIGTSTNLSLNFVLTNDIDCSQTSSWNPLYGASAVDIGAANAGTVYQIPNAPLQPGSVTVKVYNITRTTGFVIDHEAGTVTFDDLPSTLYGVSTSRRVTVDYTSINPIYYRGFNPIGVNTSAFTGRINGNGFKILDLFIYRPTTNYVGIFGYAGSGAQISNLGMLGGNITGYDYTGGIVGYSASSSTVSKSFVNGIQVTGYYHVGGLVGYNNTNGVITESYSINFRVLPISSGSRYVGGLVGTNIGSISNSYTRGILLGGTYQGGFAGRSTGSISNSFSASAIDDNGCAIGFGGNGTTNVTNSFWDTSVSTCASSYGLVPGTTTQALQTLSTFTDAGWDFSSTWSFDENKNNGYPYLINNDTGIDPIIEIDSVEDLQNIANNPGARFIQTADIDASSTASWNSGAGFLPIPIFYGQYEGNGFTITNLTINRPDTYYIGIFAQNRGVIRNMKIADSSFTGDYYTGSIAGFNSGTLYRSKSYRLNDSSNQVTGDYYTGGLVGQNSATGVITQGYAVANVIAQVSGSRYIGGLVGSNLGSISDCYARGSVSSGSFQGGLVGTGSGSISNSFSASVVEVIAFNGGFGGSGTTNVTSSFWDIGVSGYDTSYGGVGTTTQALQTLSTFTDAGWDFSSTWSFDENKNNGYPYLINNDTGIDPIIEIDSVEDLQNIADNPGSRFIQTADIDASSTASWNDGAGFLPIPIFYGQYEGNGFTIGNLTISRPSTYYVGIFAENRGIIRNMKVFDSSFTGDYYTGSIAGFNSGTLYRSKSYRLNDSSNQVTGDYYTGGLVGQNGATGIITEGYAVANVTAQAVGSRYIGGLVGENLGSISNCYARGSVSGSGYQGGLVGKSTGSVSNSFAASVVDVTAFNGGFGGYGTTNVANSFWDVGISGHATSYGGTGTTTQALKTLSTFTDAGWSFDNVWHMDPLALKNDGYPYLNPPIIPAIEIYTIDDLQNIANNPSSNYIQMADIDATVTASWNDGAGFLPIPIFYGQYEGNGFTITNLTINRPETNYVGIFGQNRGVINELSVSDSSFSGNYYTGSIAGLNSGTIYRSKSYRLNDSSNQVVGAYYTGGLVGYNGSVGTISESYSVSNISGKSSGMRYIGGLVGTNVGSISNCYARGSVSGNGYRGGFVGRSTGLITNSLSTAAVTVAAFNGGFGGHGTTNVSNSFWDITTSGYVSSYGGTGTTTQALKEQSIFSGSGWNFDSTWGINSYNNDNYPHLLFDAVGFVDPNFTLIINRIGQGSVLVNGEAYLVPLSFSPGTNIILSIASAVGWIFEKWEDDSTDLSRNLTMDEDKSLTANFIEENPSDDEDEESDEDGSLVVGSSGPPVDYSTTTEDDLDFIKVISPRVEVGDGLLAIYWTRPTSSDFAGVIIRRSTISYPSSDQGVEVYRGLGNQEDSGEFNFFDLNLTNGELYYYSIFSYDSSGKIASGMDLSGIPEVNILADATTTTEKVIIPEVIKELIEESIEKPKEEATYKEEQEDNKISDSTLLANQESLDFSEPELSTQNDENQSTNTENVVILLQEQEEVSKNNNDSNNQQESFFKFPDLIKEFAGSSAGQSVAAMVLVLSGVNLIFGTPWINLINLLRFLFTQPLSFLGKKRGVGRVYNSITKKPVDLALVRLYDLKTKKLISSRVTDALGRYLFLVEPGEYYLEVSKGSYNFPSTVLKGKSEDKNYSNLYYGGKINVTGNAKSVINSNIPLDQQEIKITNKQAIIDFNRKRVFNFLSLVGPIVSLIYLLLVPSIYSLGLFSLHVVLLLVFRRIAEKVGNIKWGVVFDLKTKKPLAKAVARVFSSEYGRMLEYYVTDSRGRYGFLVGNNDYYVVAEKDGYQQVKTGIINLSGSSEEKIISQDLGLVKIK